MQIIFWAGSWCFSRSMLIYLGNFTVSYGESPSSKNVKNHFSLYKWAIKKHQETSRNIGKSWKVYQITFGNRPWLENPPAVRPWISQRRRWHRRSHDFSPKSEPFRIEHEEIPLSPMISHEIPWKSHENPNISPWNLKIFPMKSHQAISHSTQP